MIPFNVKEWRLYADLDSKKIVRCAQIERTEKLLDRVGGERIFPKGSYVRSTEDDSESYYAIFEHQFKLQYRRIVDWEKHDSRNDLQFIRDRLDHILTELIARNRNATGAKK